MQQHIGHVMMTRIHPVHPAVQHMGKPRHWMPVACPCRSERPPYVFKCQTGLYMVIAGHILPIVVVDK